MSKFKAVAYYGGIPPNNSNMEKPKILDFFVEGVNNSGDIGIAHKQMNVIDCDVALIQGFVHENGKQLPHLQLRKNVFDRQIANNKKALIVDSNLFLYVDKNNPHHYLRYSFNGVFPTTGFYFDKDIDTARWNKISKTLNLSLKDWRSGGNHILICLQRTGGWSMQGLSTVDWLNNTIRQIKLYTDRPIVVRTHPGDKKIGKILQLQFTNVSLSIKPSLIDDLRNCWASIVYNSSPSVASVMEGVPTFITDPNTRNSQSYDVANFDLTRIENPTMPERNHWIEKISMCHWNFNELRSGEAWSFFKQYV